MAGGEGRLAGKVAIITGAARGQGEAEARLFAAEGAKVVLGDVLDEAVIVQVEVSFHPLYRGQPPFAEIDGWLRARGFALHTFATLDRRPVAPVTLPIASR